MSAYKVRPECQEDVPVIEVLVTAAFGRSAESNLIALIRQRRESLGSLDATDGDIVVRHVLMSLITLDGSGKFGGIAPLCVAPEHQKLGIGSLLVNKPLLKARDESFDALFLAR
jgi:putative acetyltransferase